MNIIESFCKRNKVLGLNIFAILILLNFTLVACNQKNDYSPEDFKNTLKNFYEATYINSDMELMKESLVEEYRFYFEQAMTMAEMDKDFYKSYRQGAISVFGEDFTVDIDIKKCKKADERTKKEVLAKFENIKDVVIVEYDIIFNGKIDEKSYFNKLIFAKIENQWYMTTHLDLPIGRNVYAY